MEDLRKNINNLNQYRAFPILLIQILSDVGYSTHLQVGNIHNIHNIGNIECMRLTEHLPSYDDYASVWW